MKTEAGPRKQDARSQKSVVRRRNRQPGLFVSFWFLASGVWLLAMSSVASAQGPTGSPTESPIPSATPLHTRTLFPTFTGSPSPTPSPTRTPPSPFIADANCDGTASAADLLAAIMVSYDTSRFPGCRGAESFRGRPLTENDFLALFNDLFATFAVRWTPTPSATRTVTRTATRTHTRTATPLVSATPTPTATPTATPTVTSTPLPSLTRTPSRTGSATPTRTATPAPTPTGLAYQLSGQWAANWGNQFCFLLGQPFLSLQDVVYQVTAIDGQLDIEVVDGERIGRGLTIEAGNRVRAVFTAGSGHICRITQVEQRFRFDYAFTFNLNGTGTATASWSFGVNTNCESCQVTDSATLRRISGPGT